MVDMGITGKVRPAVVVLDDQVPVERAIIVHVLVTSQNAGQNWRSPSGIFVSSLQNPWPTCMPLALCPEHDLSANWELSQSMIWSASERRCGEHLGCRK